MLGAFVEMTVRRLAGSRLCKIWLLWYLQWVDTSDFGFLKEERRMGDAFEVEKYKRTAQQSVCRGLADAEEDLIKQAAKRNRCSESLTTICGARAGSQ